MCKLTRTEHDAATAVLRHIVNRLRSASHPPTRQELRGFDEMLQQLEPETPGEQTLYNAARRDVQKALHPHKPLLEPERHQSRPIAPTTPLWSPPALPPPLPKPMVGKPGANTFTEAPRGKPGWRPRVVA
jgi:hypothetical protein